MQIEAKAFNILTINNLFDIYKLRNEVFIVEQNCAYQDVDEKDKVALHVLVKEGEKLIAYARLLPENVSYKEPSIGRVIVSKAYRQKGVGMDLMKFCLLKCEELFKNQLVTISAQSYLVKFYQSLGFKTVGEEYLEDNIPHIKMMYNKAVK